MIDSSSGNPVPIVSVTLDPHAGDVIPVGGSTSEHSEEDPVMIFDLFTEPLSNLPLKVTGARIVEYSDENEIETELEPLGGGFQAVVDVYELYHEAKLLDALQEFKEGVTGPNPTSGRHEMSILEQAEKDLHKARFKVKTHLIRAGHDINRRKERVDNLAENGGSPGMYEFSATGQLLPILVGTCMKDPSGSGLEVPILSIEKDREADKIIPLGGSMEDPSGEGLVPIMIGETAVDPVTEEMSTICGVKLNKEIGIAEPVTISSSGRKVRKAPPGSVSVPERTTCGIIVRFVLGRLLYCSLSTSGFPNPS